jgi:hypothetical protein
VLLSEKRIMSKYKQSPFIYRNPEGTTTGGEIDDLVKLVLTGDPKLAPGGTWENLVGRKIQSCEEPLQVREARTKFTENKGQPYDQAKLDWSPGNGWIPISSDT